MDVLDFEIKPLLGFLRPLERSSGGFDLASLAGTSEHATIDDRPMLVLRGPREAIWIKMKTFGITWLSSRTLLLSIAPALCGLCLGVLANADCVTGCYDYETLVFNKTVGGYEGVVYYPSQAYTTFYCISGANTGMSGNSTATGFDYGTSYYTECSPSCSQRDIYGQGMCSGVGTTENTLSGWDCCAQGCGGNCG